MADAIEAELAKAGKHAKVRTVRTGCSGECERGPIVRLMPCDLMYYHVSVKDAPAIVASLDGDPVKRLLYNQDRKFYEHMADNPFYARQHKIVLADVGIIDPLDLDAAVSTVRRVADEPGVKAIVFRSPCVVLAKPRATSAVDADRCVGCPRCVRELGCPALVPDAAAGKVRIDAAQCTGCTLCEQVCPTHAISGGERL